MTKLRAPAGPPDDGRTPEERAAHLARLNSEGGSIPLDARERLARIELFQAGASVLRHVDAILGEFRDLVIDAVRAEISGKAAGFVMCGSNCRTPIACARKGECAREARDGDPP